MKQTPTINLSAYSRKMLINGSIILLDTSEIKAHTAQLQKIGVNVNQIAKRINETGRDYLKVGLYTEVLFVEKGVRFVATNNGIDSANQHDSDFPLF